MKYTHLALCFTLYIISTVAVFSQISEKLVYPYAFAPSEGLVNKYEKQYRSEICLNGYWDFQPVKLPQNYKQGKGIAPELSKPSNDAWEKTQIKVPSPWNINSFANRNDIAGPDHRNYPSYPKNWEDVKMAWLKKNVTIPANWDGKAIKLYFEAVAGYTEVYVNNVKVTDNFDLFLPFEIDITNKVTPGQTIEIFVGVRSQQLFEDNSTIGRRIMPAGSMWGYHINGIWQDVYLYAIPKINIQNIFVRPLVSKNRLEMDVTLTNNTDKKASVSLQGSIKEWINHAGTDVNSAPVPAWELGRTALEVAPVKITLEAGKSQTITLKTTVNNELNFWSPETPNLYGLLLSLNEKKATLDLKYERFGWREWTFDGTKQCLNGKPYELRGESWHFMGVPQLTRRYAWAWFTALKNMNANAVRPHAQVYPRFYLDVADEMGICILNETANWASDGGPKMDSELFWENSKTHLRRFVQRDRNHASVFGWSISNENKPVILHVYNRPDLIPTQEKAWKDWRNIVQENDPTRPWISADGEDDGNGILPVTVGHYGDINSMKRWLSIGKPWGVGEHSMAYYGTPEQVSKYNGERAYESMEGRMEGLANECYNLIANQRKMGASYVSVFNMAWYSLKPLAIGKKDLTTEPSITNDGVFFENYTEGAPGIQPERMGPYSTTFNPGYDPSLHLYDTWPMYDAMRAANAPNTPAYSPWETVNKIKYESNDSIKKKYKEIIFIGKKNSELFNIFENHGVKFAQKVTSPLEALFIIDGSSSLKAEDEKTLLANISKGANVLIWGVNPQSSDSYKKLLPLELKLEERPISSFIPVQKSWMKGLNNSDFYFCEVQKTNASSYGMYGALVDEGETLLNACNTDWSKWNKRPEEIKTAAVLRSEREAKGAAPAFVKYKNLYVSTLTEFANSEKGFSTFEKILRNAGISFEKPQETITEMFFIRDGEIQFPAEAKKKLKKSAQGGWEADFWVWSNRPLDDLLIEPDMPKLNLFVITRESKLTVNGKPIEKFKKNQRDCEFLELPLQQGWNHLVLNIGENDVNDFKAALKSPNKKEFLPTLKISFNNPEQK